MSDDKPETVEDKVGESDQGFEAASDYKDLDTGRLDHDKAEIVAVAGKYHHDEAHKAREKIEELDGKHGPINAIKKHSAKTESKRSERLAHEQEERAGQKVDLYRDFHESPRVKALFERRIEAAKEVGLPEVEQALAKFNDLSAEDMSEAIRNEIPELALLVIDMGLAMVDSSGSNRTVYLSGLKPSQFSMDEKSYQAQPKPERKTLSDRLIEFAVGPETAKIMQKQPIETLPEKPFVRFDTPDEPVEEDEKKYVGPQLRDAYRLLGMDSHIDQIPEIGRHLPQVTDLVSDHYGLSLKFTHTPGRFRSIGDDSVYIPEAVEIEIAKKAD